MPTAFFEAGVGFGASLSGCGDTASTLVVRVARKQHDSSLTRNDDDPRTPNHHRLVREVEVGHPTVLDAVRRVVEARGVPRDLVPDGHDLPDPGADELGYPVEVFGSDPNRLVPRDRAVTIPQRRAIRFYDLLVGRGVRPIRRSSLDGLLEKEPRLVAGLLGLREDGADPQQARLRSTSPRRTTMLLRVGTEARPQIRRHDCRGVGHGCFETTSPPVGLSTRADPPGRRRIVTGCARGVA